MISANAGDKFAGNSGPPADSMVAFAGLSVETDVEPERVVVVESTREKAPRRRMANAPMASKITEFLGMGAFISI
jgi:hypothetical protein